MMGLTCSRLPLLYKTFYKTFLTGFVILCAANFATAAEPAARIKGGLDEGSRFTLTGNVRPVIAKAQDQGSVSGSTKMPRMTIHFAMTASQNADLLQLMRLQQTRHSTQFHQWLTPEQYADRFGLNSKDIEKVTAWLESVGFTNVESARSRNLISFDGTAAQAETAFHANIHRYSLNGVTHIANATEPELPKALNGLVEGIRGLHDFHPKPHGLHPHFTSGVSGNIFLVPNDFATIYDLQPLYTAGVNGTGYTIAIPGQTDIALTDIEAFQTAAGLPVKDPTQVLVAGASDPGTNTNDEQESDLDIEWAGGLATGSNIIFVYSGDVFTSVTYAITNNLADVLPITYGNCESETGSAEVDSMNQVFMQAAAEGMTVLAASGDDGAADCDEGTATTPPSVASQGLAVDYPGTSAYVTSVGGTEFNEGTGTGNPSCVLSVGTGTGLSACQTYWNTTVNTYGGSAKSYIPEIAWNDTSTVGYLEATGGGVSIYNAKPSWQTGTGVPSGSFRDVPDLSMDASPEHDGLLYCSGGSCVVGFRASAGGDLNVTGGTSADSPSFAAIVALLDQKMGGRQGLVNPNLYALASVSTDAFHDITSGNNIVPCQGGTPNCSSTVSGVDGTLGFSAGTGYDQVTGLGSIDADHLLSEWDFDLTSSINPTSLSVTAGTSGTAAVTVAETKFATNVTFTCSVASTLANVTCAIPGTVPSGSGTATLTVTAASTAGAPWWRRSPQFPTGNRGLLSLLAGLLLLTVAYLATRQKKMQALSAVFALMLIVGLSSCGGGGSSETSTLGGSGTGTTSTAAETGVVTVVATAGSLTSTSTISVTIPAH